MNREVHVRFWERAGLRCLALLAYLHAYDSVAQAQTSIDRYIDGFYNSRWPRSSLERRTPDQAHFNLPAPILAVA